MCWPKFSPCSRRKADAAVAFDSGTGRRRRTFTAAFKTETLEPAFEEAVQKIEEETQMSYVTSVERVRLKREREEGKVEGFAALLSTLVNRKFGMLPDWAKVRLLAADDVTLQRWAEQVLDAQCLEDVFR